MSDVMKTNHEALMKKLVADGYVSGFRYDKGKAFIHRNKPEHYVRKVGDAAIYGLLEPEHTATVLWSEYGKSRPPARPPWFEITKHVLEEDARIVNNAGYTYEAVIYDRPDYLAMVAARRARRAVINSVDAQANRLLKEAASTSKKTIVVPVERIADDILDKWYMEDTLPRRQSYWWERLLRFFK